MKKLHVVAGTLAFAAVVVACRAPSVEKLAEAGAGSVDLMKSGAGGTCSVTCSSLDKLQSCCCGGVNPRCVSNQTTCQCKNGVVSGGFAQ